MFPDGIPEMPDIENPVFRRMRVGVDFDHVDAEEFIRRVFREIRFRRTDEHCLFFASTASAGVPNGDGCPGIWRLVFTSAKTRNPSFSATRSISA